MFTSIYFFLFKLESRTVKIQELKKTLQDHNVETLPEQKTENTGLTKKTKVSDIQGGREVIVKEIWVWESKIKILVAFRASLEELFVCVSFHLRIFNILPQSVGFLNQGLGVMASLHNSFHPIYKKSFI